MINGLKDYQIAGLVNAITKELQPITKIQATREIISQEVMEYLEYHNLRIDKPSNTNKTDPYKNTTHPHKTSSNSDNGTIRADLEKLLYNHKKQGLLPIEKDSIVKRESPLTSKCDALVLRRRVPFKEEIKPTLVRRVKSIYPSKQVEILFNYWNSLGNPIKKHQENPETKVFKTSIKLLVKYSNKYDIEEIKKAMYHYHRLINYPNTLLNFKAPGHLVGLPDFFEFSQHINERIVVANAGRKPEDDILHDVDSWFIECCNDWEYLTGKFDKQPKCAFDAYPEVTKELAKQYRERINNCQFTPQEHNMLIKASSKMVNYFNNIKDKLNFSSCPLERDNPKLFTRHMIDSLLANVTDMSIVKVSWLITENHFLSRMPIQLKKIGMLGAHHSSSADLMSEDMKVQRKKEFDNLRFWNRAEAKKIYDANLTKEEENNKLKSLKRQLDSKWVKLTEEWENKI
jgi:hypothetical protein